MLAELVKNAVCTRSSSELICQAISFFGHTRTHQYDYPIANRPLGPYEGGTWGRGQPKGQHNLIAFQDKYSCPSHNIPTFQSASYADATSMRLLIISLHTS